MAAEPFQVDPKMFANPTEVGAVVMIIVVVDAPEQRTVMDEVLLVTVP